MILFDDLSDGKSIDDSTESYGDIVETRECGSESAEDSTSDDTDAMIWTLLTVVSF
jgi:hypothetical protein